MWTELESNYHIFDNMNMPLLSPTQLDARHNFLLVCGIFETFLVRIEK
jgi:hypothetical protein